jgi:prephenate dehydrogenase
MPVLPRVTIVGVGLMGASIGLALKQRQLAQQVTGVVRRQASGNRALESGGVDAVTTNLVEGVSQADLVVVATPVDQIVDTVRSVATVSPRCLITDVGSTKAEICRQIYGGSRPATQANSPSPPVSPAPAPAPNSADCVVSPVSNGVVAPGAVSLRQFVGSHPIAGDHRSGPEFARADLLQGRTVVVTPRDGTPASVVETWDDFWTSLGAEVTLLDPEEHDRALASTSHLPHLVASVLAKATPEAWLRLAGTGWEDTTRVAAASPELWTQIFRQNRQAVIDAVRRFEHVLASFGNALEQQDDATLIELLQEAKRIRDGLGD